jgi:hypothetical protein
MEHNNTAKLNLEPFDTSIYALCEFKKTSVSNAKVVNKKKFILDMDNYGSFM